MSDTLILREIVAECRLGVFDWERATPQRIWVDVELEIDAAKAATRDDVRRAVDYARVVTRVREVAKRQPYRLLETLSETIAAAILEEFQTPRVRLRVKKRAMEGVDYAAVEVERRAGRAWRMARRGALARRRSTAVEAR